jgi:translocator protein
MNSMQLIKLVISIGLPLAIGAFAGMYTSEAVPEWYANLNKPSFNPPGWVFGPAWTALYILMGISLFLVWKEAPGQARNLAMGVFFFQLALNFAWSFIFFYSKMIGPALIEIIVLWISIVIMMVLFYKIRPLAAWINIPYLLWVSFASVLNASYFVLNRG